VVIDFVGLKRDGVRDGGEGVTLAAGLVELAGREVVEGKGVVRLLGEGFAKGPLGVGVAPDLLELEAAEDLGRSAARVAHFLIPRKSSTSS
jgi:hypothetical protein